VQGGWGWGTAASTALTAANTVTRPARLAHHWRREETACSGCPHPAPMPWHQGRHLSRHPTKTGSPGHACGPGRAHQPPEARLDGHLAATNPAEHAAQKSWPAAAQRNAKACQVSTPVRWRCNVAEVSTAASGPRECRGEAAMCWVGHHLFCNHPSQVARSPSSSQRAAHRSAAGRAVWCGAALATDIPGALPRFSHAPVRQNRASQQRVFARHLPARCWLQVRSPAPTTVGLGMG
jgi:hypothetical protein